MILPILRSSLDTSTAASAEDGAPFFSFFSALGLDDFSFFLDLAAPASASPVAPLAALVLVDVAAVVLVGVSTLGGVAMDDSWAVGGADEGMGI